MGEKKTQIQGNKQHLHVILEEYVTYLRFYNYNSSSFYKKKNELQKI